MAAHMKLSYHHTSHTRMQVSPCTSSGMDGSSRRGTDGGRPSKLRELRSSRSCAVSPLTAPWIDVTMLSPSKVKGAKFKCAQFTMILVCMSNAVKW